MSEVKSDDQLAIMLTGNGRVTEIEPVKPFMTAEERKKEQRRKCAERRKQRIESLKANQIRGCYVILATCTGKIGTYDINDEEDPIC